MKHLKYFFILPIIGTAILYLIIYIKAVKKEFDIHILSKMLFSTMLFGTASIFICYFLSLFIINLFNFQKDPYHAMVFSFFFGGYLMNIFSFKLIKQYKAIKL